MNCTRCGERIRPGESFGATPGTATQRANAWHWKCPTFEPANLKALDDENHARDLRDEHFDNTKWDRD